MYLNLSSNEANLKLEQIKSRHKLTLHLIYIETLQQTKKVIARLLLLYFHLSQQSNYAIVTNKTTNLLRQGNLFYFVQLQGVHGFNSLKKSCPLSSTSMKAGKSSTRIFHTASIPNSGYSTHSMLLMLL